MAAKTRTGLQVLTANRLRDGEVVYADAAGGWTTCFAGARVITDPSEADAALARAGADVAARLILDPYLFDVSAGTGTPASVRERIRAAGPTVRTDLGKQAAGRGDAHVPL